jgi:type VI secretion system FHA domain protein
MQLRLTVVRDPRRLLGERSVHSFGEAGGTIGRNSGCNLVISDGGNVISSRHAEIGFNGRGFVVTDTSTNGVYLNRTDAPLGRGNSAVLTHGDLLYIGELVFKAEIAEESRDSRARLGLSGGDGWTQARNNRPPTSAPPAPSGSLDDFTAFRPAASASSDPLAGFAAARPAMPSAKPQAPSRDPLAELNASAEPGDDLGSEESLLGGTRTPSLLGGSPQRPGAAAARQITQTHNFGASGGIPPGAFPSGAFPSGGMPAGGIPPGPLMPNLPPNPLSAPPAPAPPRANSPIPDLSELMAPARQEPQAIPSFNAGGFAQTIMPQNPVSQSPIPQNLMPPTPVPQAIPSQAPFAQAPISQAPILQAPMPQAPLPIGADFFNTSQPFNPPPAVQPSGTPQIPDDFSAHLTGLAGFAPQASIAPQQPVVAQPQQPLQPQAVVPPLGSSQPIVPQPAFPDVTAMPPLPGQRSPLRPDFAASFVNLRRKDEAGAPQGGAPSLDPVSVLRRRGEGRPAPEPTRIGLTRTPMPRGPGDAAAMPDGGDDLTAFWQALGIDPTQVDAAKRAAILQTLAATVRESITGLIEVLSARSAIKDEFRMDQTQIQPQQNNPLKFFRTGEEALRRTLLATQPGFLPLDVATRKGFDDIKAHEVAAMTAMQKAIPVLFQRLSPVAIEQAAAPSTFGRKPDKSKLWDQFVELYNRFADTLEFSMPETIAKEFARVYREQIDQMNNGGPK